MTEPRDLGINPALHNTVCMSVAQSCPTLCDPLDCSPQGSSVGGFFRQEYWSGLPFPSPGDLPNPGIEPRSPTLRVDSLPSEPLGKPKHKHDALAGNQTSAPAWEARILPLNDSVNFANERVWAVDAALG